MKFTILVIGLFLLQPNIAGAQILPPMEEYSVDVAFSKGLERRMSSINNLEQTYETRFRKNRHDARSAREAGSQRFAESRTEGTEWAGERLIGEPSDFTLENLVKAIVAYNVNRTVPEFRGRIEIDISRLTLSNASIAFLDSHQSYAAGRIKVTDADGSVQFDDKVRINLVINTTVNTSYDGPELAFIETEPARRVGPTLAYFVQRALQQAWPEHEDDFAGPIIVRLSQPNEQLIFRQPSAGMLRNE